jgi:hypothetical protein
VYNKRQFFGIGFKAAIVAVWQAPSTILVGVLISILAVALQLRCESLEKRTSVKKYNERKIMKTNKNGRNTNSKISKVMKAATKVASSVSAGIAGRCLLP